MPRKKDPAYEYLKKIGVKAFGICDSYTSTSGSYWRLGKDPER